MYTIDANVFVNAADSREAGHADSRRFLDVVRARALPVTVPTLVLAEVAAAIIRTRGDEALAHTLVAQIRRLPHFTFVPLTLGGAQRAATLAIAQRLRGADAIYATIAVRAGTTLISYDNEHRTRLGGVVPVQTPAEALAALPPV
jgi:predicted nucleic acid-binding protein